MARLIKKLKKQAAGDATISIYLDNLGMMNEGIHAVGRWVDLPMDSDDLDKLLDEIAAAGEKYGAGDEWYVADVSSKIRFSGEFLDPHALNEFAQLLEDEKMDEEVAAAIFEACSSIEEASSIIENGDYTVYHDCADMEDVAYEYIDSIGGVDQVNNYHYYIDYDALTRDLMIDGQFDEDENGEEIEETEYEREERYKELADQLADEDPEGTARNYFDYEKFGRDMDIEGSYYKAGNDMVAIHH